MKSTTIRVKARDTRLPWLPILLVALITFLASGCAAEDPLVLTFDEVETTAPTTSTAPTQIAAATTD